MNDTLTTLLAGGLYLCALGLTFWWIHRNMPKREAHWETSARELPADNIGEQPPLTIRRAAPCAKRRKSISI